MTGGSPECTGTYHVANSLAPRLNGSMIGFLVMTLCGSAVLEHSETMWAMSMGIAPDTEYFPKKEAMNTKEAFSRGEQGSPSMALERVMSAPSTSSQLHLNTFSTTTLSPFTFSPLCRLPHSRSSVLLLSPLPWLGLSSAAPSALMP